jgi:hypothetical protein
MKPLLLSLFVLLSNLSIAVEVGNPDFIKYNGEYLMIEEAPMDEFFKKHPELAPKNAVTVFLNMTKDYSAVYEIKNGTLYLIELNYSRGNGDGDIENVDWIAETFKDQNEVKIDWFTNVLIILPRTRNLEPSKCEMYHTVKIIDGEVKGINGYTEKEFYKFRHQLFRQYRKSTEFKLLKKEYSFYSKKEIERLFIGNSIFGILSKY